MSKQATALVDDVVRAAAHLEPELEEALGEHGLTRPSYLVLLALLGAEQHRLTQRELMASVRRAPLPTPCPSASSGRASAARAARSACASPVSSAPATSSASATRTTGA